MLPILQSTAFSSPDILKAIERQKVLRILQSHGKFTEKLRNSAKKWNESQERSADFMESQIPVMKKIIENENKKPVPDLDFIKKVESLIEKTELLIVETRKTKVTIPK